MTDRVGKGWGRNGRVFSREASRVWYLCKSHDKKKEDGQEDWGWGAVSPGEVTGKHVARVSWGGSGEGEGGQKPD